MYIRFKNETNKLRENFNVARKHISTEYRFNDRDIRTKILAGIIDSCGYIHRTGCYRMTYFESLLSEDIRYRNHWGSIVSLTQMIGTGK